MSKCPTTSGQFQCSKDVGHSDECSVTAKEYDCHYIRYDITAEIDCLRHVEKAALQLMKWPIASERFTENLSELFAALKDRE